MIASNTTAPIDPGPANEQPFEGPLVALMRTRCALSCSR